MWTRLVSLWNRARAIGHRDELDADLAEEMRIHRELLERDRRAMGASADDAHYAARRRFGNQTQVAEESRDMWSFGSIETWLQDIRYAARFLRRSPGFTLVAILSLGLGIGANTAVFTLINAVLVRSLPVRDPASLMLVEPSRNGTDTASVFSYPYYEALRDENTVFDGLMASSDASGLVVDHGQGPETLPNGALLVSGNYFPTLGVRPLAGRLFTREDDRIPGGHPVAVISHRYWQRAFGADPRAVGRDINVNGRVLTIVGITPPEFFGTQVGENPDLYLTMMMDVVANRGGSERAERGDWWIEVMGRLKPGVSAQQAASQLTTIFRRDMLQYSEMASDPKSRPQVERAHVAVTDASAGLASLRRRFSKPLLVLAGMSALVLLIACTNIASLMVARGAARRREMAVRVSLGAGRKRLVRQMLTESVLLALLGGGVALAIAFIGNRLLLTIFQTGRAALNLDMRPDARVLGFTALVALVSGIAFGIAPAFNALRVDLTHALKEGAGSGRARGTLRLGKLLIVSQVAFSVLLLFGASLFVRSLQRLNSVDLGFRKDGILMVRLNGGQAGYRGSRLTALYAQIFDRLGAVPGVREVAFVSHPPFSMSESGFGAKIEGYTPPEGEFADVTRVIVSPNYFSFIGIPLRAGRMLTDADAAAVPRYVVVNETFAKQYASGSSPVGRHIYPGGKTDVGIEIVGAVGDAKFNSLREPPPPVAYWIFRGDTARLGYATFMMKTDPAASRVVTDVRSAIASVDRQLAVLSVKTLDAQIDASISNERVVATLSGFYGSLALALAMIGLYGVMNYAVTRRTRELGVRIALGAERASVLGLVLRETLVLVTLGAAIGIPVALALGKLGSALLYDLSPTDVPTMVITTAILFAIAVLAGWWPARRAASIDPLTALRSE